MKKLLTIFLTVLLIFTFVSFAGAQDSDPMEGVEIYDGSFKWVPGNLPWFMFIPHYDIAGSWWTGLVIHNMSINANQYTISFCNNNGDVMATKGDSLTAFQKKSYMLVMDNPAYYEAATNCGTGWMVIESQFQVMGFVNFGQSNISVTTLGPFLSF